MTTNDVASATVGSQAEAERKKASDDNRGQAMIEGAILGIGDGIIWIVLGCLGMLGSLAF